MTVEPSYEASPAAATTTAPVTELHRRKLDHRFQLLDRDGDSYLEESDYTGLATAMADALDLHDNHPARIAAVNTCQALFDRMCARLDTTGTRRISRSQFTGSVLRSLVQRPDRFDQIIGPMCKITFDIGDLDHNELISRAEFIKLMVAGRVPPADAVTAFEKMAPGTGGYMTRGQFHQGCREFYCGADPDLPGNWMYGTWT